MATHYPISNQKDEMASVVKHLARVEALISESAGKQSRAKGLGRSSFTRIVDFALAAARRYLPPIHWLGVVLTACILYLYVRLVALTGSLRTIGEREWPGLSPPCVVALWHRDAPSFLVGFAKRRPQVPCSIMISRDSRGDCLALLCRMLGLRVVRGGVEGGGWEALADLARALLSRAIVIITADGGGPACVAKVGPLAIASAAAVPLVLLAANCSPAIEERHKWDKARDPLPFSSVVISAGSERTVEPFADSASIEEARIWLERELNRRSVEAAAFLCETDPKS